MGERTCGAQRGICQKESFLPDRPFCDCSVATSGVAGPGGGSPEKPVGTVWIAAALKEQVVSHCYHFGTVRAENIQSAADTALTMLLELLQKSDG